MTKNLKFNAWFLDKDTEEHLGKFDTLKEAQQAIYNHPRYKKTKFTKKGDASSRNPNQYEAFKIYDNQGYGWYIK